ncbi:hypothetical protein [Streptomyces sp. NPDC048551]|uniref:hypothetical protein n=1 Tax=Streptomyces sp. NPDC048551 TaxID=3155758 RepID=UPI00342D329A
MPAPTGPEGTRSQPSAPTAPLDLAVLLREHVLPALVGHGAVEAGEVPVIAEPSSSDGARRPVSAPAPGTAVVRPGRMSVRQPDQGVAAEVWGPGRGGPAPVNVHIDQVTVTRAAPAASPAPPPQPAPHRPRPGSDHSAYLARRKERR